MGERRRAARQRTFKAAKIELNRDGAARCMVRNLSPTGAFLEFGTPTDLPDKFVLVILSNHAQRNCEVVWRQRNRIGIAFTGPEFSGSITPDPARASLVRAAIAASASRGEAGRCNGAAGRANPPGYSDRHGWYPSNACCQGGDQHDSDRVRHRR
jgi:hypothetical protein